jgi:hypothetical protein
MGGSTYNGCLIFKVNAGLGSMLATPADLV